MAQNHVIDPTYFYDALAEFSFTYTIYHAKGLTIDSLGKQHYNYEEDKIVGSLQSQGHRIQKKIEGNISVWEYNFYCKSLYRINYGDIIKYQDRYLVVDNDVKDYDEWGVRSAHLIMMDLAANRDFAEWLKYKEGQIIV